jgi:hypothetical protein
MYPTITKLFYQINAQNTTFCYIVKHVHFMKQIFFLFL